MSRTVKGDLHNLRQLAARKGRKLIREREERQRQFEKLKRKGKPPKTGLRS